VGFSINLPRLEVSFAPSDAIVATGPDSKRAREFLRHIAEEFGWEGGIRLHVHQHIPVHVGLGSGTQLALACGVAWSLSRELVPQVHQIARASERSFFSGIGLATFASGGFVVDQGYAPGNLVIKEPIAPLVRFAVPADWRVVVVIPNTPQQSKSHVIRLDELRPPVSIQETRELAHQVLVRLLPAIAGGDHDAFCKALSEVGNLGYKRQEMEQYGTFITDLVQQLKMAGADCVGMSSGGPTVYAIMKDNSKTCTVQEAAKSYLVKYEGGQVFVASFDNAGARWFQDT